jgi:hypothetical protein
LRSVGKEHFGERGINTEILQAWTKINLAKSSGYRKDWLSLSNLKDLTATEIQNLQGEQSISDIMKSNSRQPCATCQVNSSTKMYLQPLDQYLLDLKYFSRFHAKDGYITAINLLKSATLAQKLEPEAYILKIIKLEGLSVKELEKRKIGCEPDVVLTDGTICEFKSWRINPSDLQEENDVEEEDYNDGNTTSSYNKSKTQFENFKAGHTGVKQFIAYLSLAEIDSMNKLRYYFDAKKGPTEIYVKTVFKDMMLKNDILTPQGINVFNAIWGNIGLRGKLFGDEDNIDDARENFITLIAITNNSFYNFIIVK